jgi:hypothetical protein
LKRLHKILNVGFILSSQDEDEGVLPIYYGIAANFNTELERVLGIDMGE